MHFIFFKFPKEIEVTTLIPRSVEERMLRRLREGNSYPAQGLRTSPHLTSPHLTSRSKFEYEDPETASFDVVPRKNKLK